MVKFLTLKDKNDFKDWHKNRYKKDLDLAEEIKDTDENWAVIIGYYAMHNITKLFLAENNIYLQGGEHVHDQCIKELEAISVTHEQYLKDTLELLKLAKETSETLLLKPKEWSGVLNYAKSERSTANYYRQRKSTEAKEFLSIIVTPYIKTFEKLVK